MIADPNKNRWTHFEPTGPSSVAANRRRRSLSIVRANQLNRDLSSVGTGRTRHWPPGIFRMEIQISFSSYFPFLTRALLIGWPPSGALFNFPGKTRVETPRGWPAKEDRQSSGGNEDHFALDHCSMCTHIRDPHTRWLQLVILTHRPCRERDGTLFLTTRPPTPCRRMLNHQSLPQSPLHDRLHPKIEKGNIRFIYTHRRTQVTAFVIRRLRPSLPERPATKSMDSSTGRAASNGKWAQFSLPYRFSLHFHCADGPAFEKNRKWIIQQHFSIRQQQNGWQ